MVALSVMLCQVSRSFGKFQSVLKCFSTIRTKNIVRIDGSLAMRAHLLFALLLNCYRSTCFIGDSVAIFACPEGDSLLHREEGDEEETQVVIDSLLTDFRMTAGCTNPGYFGECNSPGLNTTYDKKHCLTLLLYPYSITNLLTFGNLQKLKIVSGC